MLGQRWDYVKTDKTLRRYVGGYSISLLRASLFFAGCFLAIVKLPYLVIRAVMDQLSQREEPK